MITTSSSSSSTSPIIIPVSSAIRVLGKNYDESILLTSKYNQSLLRDRRRRSTNVIDNQTGIRQINSSLYYQLSNRVNVNRRDQVCAYPRRSYRRQRNTHPYMLTAEAKPLKTDLNENNQEILIPIEQKTSEDIKNEILTNLNDDQVVVPNDDIETNKIFKRQMMINNFNCLNCKQKFKNRNQLNSHLIKCQFDSEQKEQINRRHHSKSESLLVSLLKQEAITEKRQEKFSALLLSQPIVSIKRDDKLNDLITNNSNNIQCKLDDKDTDFIIKKQRTSKKPTNKNQSLTIPSKVLPLITCTICGEGNMINDELIRCSTCEKSMHAYKCLNFERNNIVKTIKTYPWQCADCKKCIQCGTVEHDDELLFCDYCDRAYHMDCLNPPLSEPPPGAWYCQLCL